MKKTIIIRNGKVMEAKTSIVWKGIPWTSIRIKREFLYPDLFTSSIGLPLDPYSPNRGSIDVVVKPLGELASRYKQLFELVDPKEEDIRNLGFIEDAIHAGQTLEAA